ncbi:MAG: IclR family transcriptional regulator C-terminal domain-containing protein, partial [Chloroflexota bacterium]
NMTEKTTSELFRTLNCLVDRGYVAKDDVSGKYQLTLKLFKLAHRHSPLDHLLQAAEAPMQELAKQLRESCHLSVLNNNRLMVLSQALSPSTVRISMSVGATFSPITTVSGRMLLSALSPSEVAAVVETNPDYLEMSEAEREQFYERLQLVRNTGISKASDESYIGLQDVAVLIGSVQAGQIAAIAVTRLTAAKKARSTARIEEALIDCARQINERAGLSST